MTKPLKIGVSIDYFYDTIAGVESNSLELARKFKEHGHEVEIICSRSFISPKNPPDNSFPIRKTAGFYLMREYSRTMPTKWLSDFCYRFPGWLFRRGIPKILRENKYDVVFTCSYDFLRAMVEHDPVTPVVFGVPNHVWPNKEYLLKRADYIAAVGKLVQEEIKEKIGLESSYAPPVVNASRYHPTPLEERRALRKELNLKNDDKILLHANRLIPFKNCETLIRALPLILKREPKAKLLIFGQGVLKPHLQKVARDLHIEDRVTFMGLVPVGELNKYFNIADLVITPSFYESFSMVSLEAVFAGRPLLISEGMEEFRLTFPQIPTANPKSPEDIADKAFEVMNSKPQKITKKQLEPFDLEYRAKGYERIFREAIKTRRRQRAKADER